MTLLNLEDFMKKIDFKNDSMNESQLRKIYIYPVYPRDSKKLSNEGFVDLDDDSRWGSHWVCYYMKDDKFYYFDSFGGQPDKLLRNQLHKPILYHNYKKQDKKIQIMWIFLLILLWLVEN